MLLRYLFGLWLVLTAVILHIQGSIFLSPVVAAVAVVFLGNLLWEQL